MFPMESSVTHRHSLQLYEEPPSKKLRFEHPTSSASSYYSAYYNGTSISARSELAPSNVGGSNSPFRFARGTRDDRETTSHASTPSSASGNFGRSSPCSSDATLWSNQSGEAADAHACIQANHVPASEASIINSATYSPGCGTWTAEGTYSFPAQSNNRISGHISNFPFPRAAHFAQDGSRREVDVPASNPVSVGDNNFLASSSLSNNRIYGFLPRSNFAFPNNAGMVSILHPYSAGLGSIKSNNSGKFYGSAAGSNSSCSTWLSVPYVQNCAVVQGSSVRVNPALYISAANHTNVEGGSKIVSEGPSNRNLPIFRPSTAAQVPDTSSSNAWLAFPYVQIYNSFLNSAAISYPGARSTGLNVPCPQRSSQNSSGELNTDVNSSALSGLASAAEAGWKSSTCNTSYCSPHGQNCSSIADSASCMNPSACFSNIDVTSAQRSSIVQSDELSTGNILNSALSAAMQDGNTGNSSCNNEESESRDCIHGSKKDYCNVSPAILDSKEGVIQASLVEVPSADLKEDGNSATTATTCGSNAISAEETAEAADVNSASQIGPRLFPNGHAAQAKSLILQASLDAAKGKQQKLKWPLPIPISIKIQDRNTCFSDIDYNYVAQCVFYASQEEPYAQGIDKKGRLRVFMKSPRAASNLLQMEQMGGVAVQCSIAHAYTDTVGYIRGVPKRYSEVALFELLQDEGVICAKRQVGYVRYDNGAVSDMLTGTVVLTFLPDRRLPQTVTIDHVSYEVIRRLQLPMQCFNCQRFGHFAKECVAPVCCRLCAGGHFYEECFQKGKPRCTNCQGDHASTFWRCPVRLAFASADPRNAWVQEHVKDI